ncbi:MAG TPA: Re/Si-specific NAD(P)(+) transhydrogenase subunit alpha [Edaphocola sp.]|nr:Re/Si-specific NAD(P)(+) transhydrogenase subunit alpha [Edaphocola sp.]
MITIGILKEAEDESRVSCSPDSLGALIKLKADILVENGAGAKASFKDEDFQAAGAKTCSRQDILNNADIILCINIPGAESRAKAAKAIWVGVFQAMSHPQEMAAWARENHTVFSLDLLPRTTRAQAMDVLSSQANIAGYKAVLLAANVYPRYFPMFMTAAGSIPPAKVLVIGAGVAGLQAIATARRLGAVVHVSDTRPAVKEEVMSLGAKFVEVEGAADASQAGGYAVEQSEDFKRRQQEKLAEVAAKSDIIITTAQIPGRKAPVIITRQMIHNMRGGSVIVDLAASTGGNTELTEDNKIVVENGVTIIGNSHLAADMPADASKMLGKNFSGFLALLIDKESVLAPDFNDELVANACVCKDGLLVNERLKNLVHQGL